MTMTYNDPAGGTASDVGTQFRTDYYYKKALVEIAKEMYFGQLANVRAMPKNMGKTIKQYHYMPILDDRNINDQGIDADGNTAIGDIGWESTIEAAGPDGNDVAGGGYPVYFVGNSAASDALAITASKTKFLAWVQNNFPAVYAAMPHTSIAADYTLQIAASAVKEVLTLDCETIATLDVYSITFNGDTITAAAVGATETAAALVALFVAATGYADMPFVVTSTVADTLTLTWKLAGAVPQDVTFLRTTGTALANDIVKATTGAWTVTDLGYLMTLEDSVNNAGNLYGSSKDVGTITGKIPALTENGGRVNRVGMTRIDIEGSIEKFGLFEEYTQESLDFDTDAELEMHLTTEMVKAANEINEDQIQIDLLSGAGVVRFTGNATGVIELDASDSVTYDDFIKLGIELDNNRTPKQTKVITGSRMIDTKVVNAARYMYVGSEMIPSIMKMTDYHSEKAFIPVAQYGAAGTIARGEIGAVGDFRIIVVPEMMKWEGDGANEVADSGFYATGGSYDVFPMLVVGDGSFTTIGFQTDGKTVKFSTKHVKPAQNYSTQDPYGEKGFFSIKWYYGLMILRPERLAVIKTVAEI